MLGVEFVVLTSGGPLFAATALVLLLGAAPTPAEEASARAKQDFKEGQQLYAAGKFPEAIDKFEAAYAAKPHPVIAFNIGRCYEQLGDVPKALRSYRDYLRGAPTASDAVAVQQLIANLEKKLQVQGVQQLLVLTEPKGAVVFIDGKARGSTPASVELRPGKHTATITLEGHEKVEKAFDMPANTSFELSFTLKPSAAPAASTTSAPVAETRPAETPAAVTAPPAATVKARPSQNTGGLRSKAWIPAAGGVVLLGVGGAFYGLAKGTEGKLRSGDPSLAAPDARRAAVSGGQTQQLVAFTLGGVGIAAVAAAGVMFFWPSKSGGTAMRVSPTVGGAMVSGEFP